MLHTPITSIFCVLIAAMLGAGGQFLIRTASDRVAQGWMSAMFSPWLWAGMGCYVGAMGLFMHAFSRRGSVTVLYPVYATTFIWAALFALLLYGQPIRPIHAVGMVLLLVGIFLMGL